VGINFVLMAMLAVALVAALVDRLRTLEPGP